jgi:hypothetical protein
MYASWPEIRTGDDVTALGVLRGVNREVAL